MAMMATPLRQQHRPPCFSIHAPMLRIGNRDAEDPLLLKHKPFSGGAFCWNKIAGGALV